MSPSDVSHPSEALGIIVTECDRASPCLLLLLNLPGAPGSALVVGDEVVAHLVPPDGALASLAWIFHVSCHLNFNKLGGTLIIGGNFMST